MSTLNNFSRFGDQSGFRVDAQVLVDKIELMVCCSMRVTKKEYYLSGKVMKLW